MMREKMQINKIGSENGEITSTVEMQRIFRDYFENLNILEI
jgi:hypothetical protein